MTSAADSHRPAHVATLLRIATAGSVDDGKSTLIGRLLHDTKTIFEDQLAAVAPGQRDATATASSNLALLTDGLRAEREQGITIDVAYRYFATPPRSFIVADTPGHAQYTRNMVTGASISRRRHRAGRRPPRRASSRRRRHAFIAALLGVQPRHRRRQQDGPRRLGRGARSTVVAKEVVDHLDSLPWRCRVLRAARCPRSPAPTSCPATTCPGGGRARRCWRARAARRGADRRRQRPPRRAVGRPRPRPRRRRPPRLRRARAGARRSPSATRSPCWPSGQRTHVSGLFLGDRELEVAEIGAGRRRAARRPRRRRPRHRARHGPAPHRVSSVVADVNWFSDRPVGEGDRLLVKHLATTVQAFVESVEHRLDIVTGQIDPSANELFMNDLGRIRLDLSQQIAYDPYDIDRVGGRAIAIDDITNTTVGALLLR